LIASTLDYKSSAFSRLESLLVPPQFSFLDINLYPFPA
jgi:hypothetical protein